MKAVMAIALATMLQLRRQRLLIVPIIGVVLSLLALLGTLLLTDGSLALERAEAETAAWASGTGAVIGATVYALIVGASLVAREIADGTLLMVAARPIQRWKIILGRVLGASVFLAAALLGVCLVYGIAASAVSGMVAPFEEPLEATLIGLPVVLLAVCVGTAFSVQGRATAAVGSAIGVSLFAFVLAAYVTEWRSEQHQRSFLTSSVQERMETNDGIVGPAANAVVRLLPFGVFASHVESRFVDRVSLALADEIGAAPHDEDAGIDVLDPRHRALYAGPVGAVPVGDPAAGVPVDPATGLPVDPAAGVPVDPATAPGEPGVPAEQPTVPKLPPEPDANAYRCAEYGGSSCMFGYRDAWTQRRIPPPPDLHDGSGLLFAWLAIPLWIGIAALLLTRRRDLAG